MLILPEYLFLRMRYPIQVYIYAINEYCRDEGTSQRKAAEKARKLFGLTTFSHSTLGRTLKKLLALVDDIVKPQHNVSEGCEVNKADDSTQAQNPFRRNGIAERRGRIRRFIDEWMPAYKHKRNEIATSSHILARRIWQEYQRLLI